MEKGVISEGLATPSLAGSCAFGVNDAGTSGKSDTRLTQRCSLLVLQKKITATVNRGTR